MSVAAYASLVSLMQVLGQIQRHHARGKIHLDKQQLLGLQANVQFLQDFFELYSQTVSKDGIRCLARRISLAAIEAEEVIDHHVVDQLRGAFDFASDKGLSTFRVALEKIVQEMESIKKELTMVNLDSPIIHYQWAVDSVPATSSQVKSDSVPATSSQVKSDSVPATSSQVKSRAMRSMVGSEDHMNRIIDELTSHESTLQVIPIVGMGGIGKTTLAKCVFDDPRTVNRFDRRIWCSISQQYSVQQILQSILYQLDKGKHENHELGEKLHKTLFGLRYLIVMDDVWSVQVWYDLKLFFPDHRKGSRIIVTTRLSNVSGSLCSKEPYKMSLLNDDTSWDLLRGQVFGQQDCSLQLKDIGKEIAKSCGGLPISIVTIAGLLFKSDMTPLYWKSVAQNVTRMASRRDDEHCLKVLSLSYDNLPMHLKPCFLHFRVYGEDSEISVQKLYKSWIAEGLIKPILDKRIEDVAKEYLKELMDRNLILIRARNLYGKIKSCGIHDLLREFCLKESKEEDFIQIPRIQDHSYDKLNECSMCSDGRKDQDLQVVLLNQGSSSSRIHISVCQECEMKYPNLHRLRVLKFPNSYSVLPTTLRLIRHRSLKADIFHSITPLLWNLQILRIESRAAPSAELPLEIWEMPQLRYLATRFISLACPEQLASLTVLQELQTLCSQNMRFSRELVERIPNLKRLSMSYFRASEDHLWYCLDNISCLYQLESLTLWTMKCNTFPTSLKKLNLKRCDLSCEDMSGIGSLPNLQVFKLHECIFERGEWIPVEGEFLQLKGLEISWCNLTCWDVEPDQFPKLECLSLIGERCLEEIPSGIGDIPTLSFINLDMCSKLLVKSARRMVEIQHSHGNESLQLHVFQEVEMQRTRWWWRPTVFCHMCTII